MTPPTRAMTERDRSFVASTWRGDYGMRNEARKRLVTAVLVMPTTRVLCVATDERTVHAWVAGQDDVLHFVYVAPELRRNGLARHLLLEMFGDGGPLCTTHEAPRRLVPRARLNPYLLAGLMSEREAA